LTAVGVVLAAGAGRRFGAPKADVALDGERLVDRAVRTLRAGGCAPVIAVVRAGTTVDGAIAVVNDEPQQGLSSSLRLGLVAAADTGSDRAVIVLADMPAVTAEAVRAVAAAPGPVALCGYPDGRGHPVAFDSSVWADVAAAIHGDDGARAYVAAHPDLVSVVDRSDDTDALVDIDTPSDLAAWRGSGVRKDGRVTEPQSILESLESDHRAISELLADEDAPTATAEGAALREQLVMALVRHFVAEEQYLDPTLREVLPERADDADAAFARDRETEQILRGLEEHDLAAERLAEVWRAVTSAVATHIADQQELFATLAEKCDPERLDKLGAEVRGAEQLAPTRPRMVAFPEAGLNKLTSFVEGYIDHARDYYSKRGVEPEA
jgi:CTP:molybdopterin cytidylyltransferase MocA